MSSHGWTTWKSHSTSSNLPFWDVLKLSELEEIFSPSSHPDFYSFNWYLSSFQHSFNRTFTLPRTERIVRGVGVLWINLWSHSFLHILEVPNMKKSPALPVVYDFSGFSIKMELRYVSMRYYNWGWNLQDNLNNHLQESIPLRSLPFN